MEKADVIDKHALKVRLTLSAFFGEGVPSDWFKPSGYPDVTPGEPSPLWEQVLEVAKGRHILGHYEYGDTNLFEWSDGKVRAAIIEELADAVVYQAWLEERAENA